MRTPNEPFPFFFGADWELEGQQRSLPKSTWNKLLPPKAAYSFISFEMRWQRGRGAICAAEGSVNEHFHTSRSVKKRREERDSRGGRRRKGEQTESRWRKIRQRLRTEKKKKEHKHAKEEESVKLRSHGGWRWWWWWGGMEGAALENTKFPSLKPSSLTG